MQQHRCCRLYSLCLVVFSPITNPRTSHDVADIHLHFIQVPHNLARAPSLCRCSSSPCYTCLMLVTFSDQGYDFSLIALLHVSLGYQPMMNRV